MSHDIFISYARADGIPHVERLERELHSAGFSTWRDTRSINEYSDFSAEIEMAIRTAQYIVCVVTPSIEQNPRSFVRRELVYAETKGKPIIPLVFPNAAVPLLIGHLTWIPFFRKDGLDWQTGWTQLIARLRTPDAPVAVSGGETDPHRDYVAALYDRIVDYLNFTVFALTSANITLRGEEAPDAVERKQVLPMAFFEMAGMGGDQPPQRSFKHFADAVEAFNGRALLLGDPGAGKTTTLFAYAREAASARLSDPRRPLPVLLPATTWNAQEQTPVAQWIAAQIPALSRDEAARLLDEGRLLLLIDGLDELGSEREDETTKERYDPRARLLALLPARGGVIVTCRVKDYGEIGQKARLNGAVVLQALDDAQMQAYLNDMPHLWDALKADDALREVARTPLLLTLFAHAYRDPEMRGKEAELKDLAHSPGDLRDKIFETYVQRRYAHEARKYKARGAAMPFTLEEIYKTLGDYAVYIISRLIAEQNEIRFLERDQPFASFTTQLHLTTINTDATHRYLHLLLRDHFALRYALDVALDQTRTVQIRLRAIYSLGSLKDLRGIPILIKALEDPVAQIRAYAISALTQLNNPEAAQLIVQMLGDTDKHVRVNAANALGRLGDQQVVEILLEQLASKDAAVRDNASEALGLLQDARAIQPLIGVIRDDQNLSVRRSAVQALGRIDHKESIPTLIAALQDQDMYIVINAAQALGRMRSANAVDALQTILTHPEKMVNSAARAALQNIATPEALAAVEAWERKQRGE